MAAYRVTWIDKPGGSRNPHSRIRKLGGLTGNVQKWEKLEDEVISEIRRGVNSFYVFRAPTAIIDVDVREREGWPYLCTRADGTPLDNLLWLPNISE